MLELGAAVPEVVLVVVTLMVVALVVAAPVTTAGCTSKDDQAWTNRLQAQQCYRGCHCQMSWFETSSRCCSRSRHRYPSSNVSRGSTERRCRLTTPRSMCT